MSRILAFALAAMLAVVLALALALDNMWPLSKKQIFFMEEQQRFITITPHFPNASPRNLEQFRENFIRQYLVERLSIVPNAAVMSRRWGNAGRIRSWSSPEVYREFSTERMTVAVLAAESFWTRRVYFIGNPTPRGQNRYAARIRTVDEFGTGQTEAKEFTIVVKLEFEETHTVRWEDRLRNPYGVVVSEFKVE
ncbi:MAG: VirB8/TrbF family protein [Alphaproteobacteria bacterium]|nr:VirB8/TrbF family protein [Alphaproteobacteria bacterium]